jgi:hypothetical protein
MNEKAICLQLQGVTIYISAARGARKEENTSAQPVLTASATTWHDLGY